MIEYKEIETQFGDIQLTKIDEDGKVWIIPMDESNSDYQAYLNKDKPQTPMVIDEASAE